MFGSVLFFRNVLSEPVSFNLTDVKVSLLYFVHVEVSKLSQRKLIKDYSRIQQSRKINGISHWLETSSPILAVGLEMLNKKVFSKPQSLTIKFN